MKGYVIFLFVVVVVVVLSVLIEIIYGEVVFIFFFVNVEVILNVYIVKFKKYVIEEKVLDYYIWIQEFYIICENEWIDFKKCGQFFLVDDVFYGLKYIYKVGFEFFGYVGYFDEEIIEKVWRYFDVSFFFMF